eukprot:SAG31_NODE_6755_length_1898_cov_1.249027_1_plen_215_part_00
MARLRHHIDDARFTAEHCQKVSGKGVAELCKWCTGLYWARRSEFFEEEGMSDHEWLAACFVESGEPGQGKDKLPSSRLCAVVAELMQKTASADRHKNVVELAPEVDTSELTRVWREGDYGSKVGDLFLQMLVHAVAAARENVQKCLSAASVARAKRKNPKNYFSFGSAGEFAEGLVGVSRLPCVIRGRSFVCFGQLSVVLFELFVRRCSECRAV